MKLTGIPGARYRGYDMLAAAELAFAAASVVWGVVSSLYFIVWFDCFQC